jgi:hypothetical protein
MCRSVFVLVALAACATPTASAPPMASPMLANDAPRLVETLVKKHGEASRARAQQGVAQVTAQWTPADGDAAALAKFVEDSFVSDPAALETLLQRYEAVTEQIDGHLVEIGRAMRWNAEVDTGPEIPIDGLFAGLDLGAHLSEDLFNSKIAFVALLNFPLASLDELERNGASLSRRQWAAVRLAKRFALRPAGTAELAVARASAEAEAYIAGYNLWMHHVLGANGARLFPKDVRLISHWNLRDQIKADYAQPDGLARQRLIAQVMDRIVTQSVPAAVIDDPRLDWDPVANTVAAAPAAEVEPLPKTGAAKLAAPPQVSNAREPDSRYAMLLGTFHASQLEDAGAPSAPSLVARRFNLDMEMSEARVRGLLEQLLTSPMVPRVAAMIEKRLGRKLEPFDLYYAGFQARAAYPEDQLDAITRKKYPNAEAYKKDIPRLLKDLGFSTEKAAYLDAHIVVDPSRGAGHALGAGRRGDFPHLRTRIDAGGMKYKGYNIAVHEMGHNVEQTFSLYDVDSTLMAGVPATAFTEALAFTFQNRDLELLGLARPDAHTERLRTLNDFWAAYEIAGAALTDIGVWEWMYAHPKATPAELREATVQLARGLWNKYYAPVLGGRDTTMLAVYSHMISSFLYLPNYPIGHLIAFQLEEKLRGPTSGAEFERAAKFGRVTPDLWMKNATGAPVSAEPLLRATEAALTAEAP